jgi:hypothetical protein
LISFVKLFLFSPQYQVVSINSTGANPIKEIYPL